MDIGTAKFGVQIVILILLLWIIKLLKTWLSLYQYGNKPNTWDENQRPARNAIPTRRRLMVSREQERLVVCRRPRNRRSQGRRASGRQSIRAVNTEIEMPAASSTCIATEI